MGFFDVFGGGLGRYAGALGGAVGAPTPPRALGGALGASAPPGAAGMAAQMGLRGPQAGPGAAPMGLQPLSQLAGGGSAPVSAGPPMNGGSGGNPMGGAPGATVLLRAPTGQTQAVPADQVDHYVARGATRV